MKTTEELKQEHAQAVATSKEIGSKLPYKQWMDLHLRIHRLQKELAKRKESPDGSR